MGDGVVTGFGTVSGTQVAVISEDPLVLARTDDGAPLGRLGEALLEACGADGPRQLIARLYAMREPMEWAALAGPVFATAGSDPGARDIVQRGGAELARLVTPLLALVEGPVVLAGGLLLNEPLLEEAVRSQVAARCVRLELPPVEGAVRLAEELLAGTGGVVG